ncbi:MAG TPA: hypothetical protein VIS07_22235 [Candidatus Binatia bacterium]
MILPSVRERRQIDRLLSAFFHLHREPLFRRALVMLCRFYRLPTPRITWFEYLDWGKTAGRTYENGEIHLVHPENWKRGRKYNSERRWINTFYHEMGHYILWADAERKADTFAARMVRGLGTSNLRLVPPVADGVDRVGLAAVAARRDGKRRPARATRKTRTATRATRKRSSA